MKRFISFLICSLVICCSAFADNVIYYVARDNVKLLQSYDEKAATLGILPKGTPAKVVSSMFAFEGLYEVKINGVRGYIKINDLSEDFIEKADNSPINVSSKPYYQAIRPTRLLQSYDENSATIAKIEQGETMQIIGSMFAFEGLYEAIYDGKKGYVLARDVEFQNRSVSTNSSTKQKETSSNSKQSSPESKVVKKSEKRKTMACVDQTQEEENNPNIVDYRKDVCEDEDFSKDDSTKGIRKYIYLITTVILLLLFWCIKKLRENEYYDEASGIQPPSHILLCIFTFIFISRILGLIAFIYALKVSDRWACKNIAGANSASHTAKVLCLTAIIILLALVFLALLLVLAFI